MPLNRKISGVFRRVKNEERRMSSVSESQLPGILEGPEDEMSQIAASLQGDNTMLRHQLEQLSSQLSTEQQERNRLNNSSRDITDLLTASRNEIRLLHEGLETARLENVSLTAMLESARDAMDDAKRAHDSDLEKTKKEHESILLEKEVIEVFNRNLHTKLNDARQRIEELEREETMQRDRVTVLEKMNEWMKSQAGGGVNTFFEEQLSLTRSNQELKAQLETQKAAFAQEKADLLSALTTEKTALQKANEQLKGQVQAESENAREFCSALDTVRQEAYVLAEERSRLEQRVSDLVRDSESLVGTPQWPATPRTILMMVLIGTMFNETSSAEAASQELRRTGPVTALSTSSLDARLNVTEAKDIMNQLRAAGTQSFSERIDLKVCVLCRRLRFSRKSQDQAPRLQGPFLDEFSTKLNQFQCCSDQICMSCLLPAVDNGIKWDWWDNLGTLQWIKCPAPSCGRTLEIRYAADLERLLSQLDDPDVGKHMKMFEKALILRQALMALDPRPPPEALAVAGALHKRLSKRGQIYSFFDPRFDSNMVDETGCIPEFRPGNIILGQVDRDQGDLSVPLFMKFFRRQSTPKECILCTQLRYEIDYGGEESWVETCEDFQGSWMWNIMLYPNRMTLDCDHEFATCKTCIAQQISTQLESNGCERITCPHCNRQLDHHEIRHFAKSEDFEKYEGLLLRKQLSSDPHFRWCLRPNCSNGQLYDETQFLDPRITCELCEFEMCFTHQLPWHEGQTCEQYDSQRDHGDPNYTQTQDWIREHSKQCPGCSINIVKDSGCFHMTCRRCQHEFCWECLANWGQIDPEGGAYNRNAHNEGCWFRTGNIEPTAIAGNDLQAALRRRT